MPFPIRNQNNVYAKNDILAERVIFTVNEPDRYALSVKFLSVKVYVHLPKYSIGS